MKIRPTVRLRLTLWYASIFFVGGALLLGIAYVVVSDNVASVGGRVQAEVDRTLGIPPGAGGVLEAADRALPPDGELTAFIERERQARAAAERKVNAETRSRTLMQFGLALGLLTLASIAAGLLVSARALRPISRITGTARRVSEDGNLEERIGLVGPDDELKELADTFDEMLGRLSRVFASQRHFVANASHELRTPLATIRAEAEEALSDPSASEADLKAMAAVVREAVVRSESLIDSLLTLAKSERGVTSRRLVDLADVVQEALGGVRADGARGIAVRSSLQPAPVTGDPILLERLVANLLENALRYNRDAGWIELVTVQNAAWSRLRVANSGPVVEESRVEELFEPFRRRDTSRSRASGGAGLGLSIVKAVAEAHGGHASALALREGGLAVEVALPATPAGGREAPFERDLSARRMSASGTGSVSATPPVAGSEA